MSIVNDFKSINERLGAIRPEPTARPVCETCEDGGWEMYGTGRGDPHFRPCPACLNPEGHPSP